LYVIVVDKEVDNLECVKEGDIEFYYDMVTALSDNDIVREYFINVSDKTWNTFKDSYAKRIFVNKLGLKIYLSVATYIFVYKNRTVKLCFPMHR